ncbi:hypothetical protein ACHAWF_013183 [Thalassiosira exigua]
MRFSSRPRRAVAASAATAALGRFGPANAFPLRAPPFTATSRRAPPRLRPPSTRRFALKSGGGGDAAGDGAPPRPDFFSGSPSTPGFRPGEFDRLSRFALSTTSNRPVVAEYQPDAAWLWTQWEGTIRQMTWKSIALTVAWASAVNWYAYHHYVTDVEGAAAGVAWYSSEIRHSSDGFFEFLASMGVVWGYLLSLVIFVLAFFVNQSYDHWKRVYFSARAMQGRINDLCMLVTAGGARSHEYGEVDGFTGYRTEGGGRDGGLDAEKMVREIIRYLRLSHTFFWASTPTRSDGLIIDLQHLPEDFDPTQLGPTLLSPEGLDLLVSYGQLKERERDAMIGTGLSPSQYPYVLLEWAMLRSMGGLRTGELVGGPGLEDNFLRQFTQLRAEYFNIGDYASGRMPMAYMIAVQIIVDLLVFSSPLALYTKLGAFSIVSTGLITLAFRGLLELSKSFLDTFGTEGYRAHNIRVDVLVSEVNFGASQRWLKAGDMLPSETPGGLSEDEITKLDELQELIAAESDEASLISPNGSIDGDSDYDGAGSK